MTENQRVRLTKRMLRESLTQLMANQSIHKISVRELCEHAQINRTTFYKYYASQYDLLKDMENEVLTQIEGYLGMTAGCAESDLQLLTRIIAYIGDNLPMCRQLINNAEDSFPEKLLNLPMIRRLLSAQISAEYGGVDMDYMYQFVVNGGFCIIKRWINKEHREAPEEIAGMLVSTLGKLFA